MPKSRHWANKSFSIHVDELETTYAEIEKIAKRENTSISSIIVKSMREYVEKHKRGNYQTFILSYSEGESVDMATIEGQIRNFFSNKNRVKWLDIVQTCKEQTKNTKDALDMAGRIQKWLMEKKIRVWR